MGNGSLRNQICWCGSKKKYKNCHLTKPEEEKPKIWEAEKLLKNSFSAKMCLVPQKLKSECNEIIRAHSISKSANLKTIARDGHVYTMNPSMQGLQKSKGRLGIELVGINKASTFTGFCKYHDKELYKEIEDEIIVPTLSQLFLLSYRAVCREIFTKMSSLDVFDKAKMIKNNQIMNLIIKPIVLGTKAAIRDLEKIKNTYDSSLLNQNFFNYSYCYLLLDKPLPIVSSGAIFPHHDFKGNLLQDLGDIKVEADELAFNAVTLNNGGAMLIFGRKSMVATKFIKSFCEVDDSFKVSTFINFLFTHFENICVSPDWWDSLSTTQRDKLLERYNSGVGPWNNQTDNALFPDKIDNIDIKVVKIIQNVI